MSVEELEAIAEAWIGAFHEQNLDALLNLYSNDAKHYSPRVEARYKDTNGWLHKKDQMIDWWQSTFIAFPLLDYKLVSIAINPPDVFMTYHRILPGQPTLEVMEYLKIEDNLIVESRVLGSWLIEIVNE